MVFYPYIHHGLCLYIKVQENHKSRLNVFELTIKIKWQQSFCGWLYFNYDFILHSNSDGREEEFVAWSLKVHAAPDINPIKWCWPLEAVRRHRHAPNTGNGAVSQGSVDSTLLNAVFFLLLILVGVSRILLLSSRLKRTDWKQGFFLYIYIFFIRKSMYINGKGWEPFKNQFKGRLNQTAYMAAKKTVFGLFWYLKKSLSVSIVSLPNSTAKRVRRDDTLPPLFWLLSPPNSLSCLDSVSLGAAPASLRK